MAYAKSKKFSVLIIITVLLAAIMLSSCEQEAETSAGMSTETVYTVYFGLNDADSGQQEVSMEEASAYIRSVIESHGYGYTEYRTYGAYTENGTSKGNDTLVYMPVFVEEADVEKIADEVIAHLNLASVLCQQQEMDYQFFVGEEKQQ